MKYTQILDVNMVPEWRDQYLDYHALNSALNKAIESKNIKSREKGVDLYFELIKFNQKFANAFSRACQAQLDKINAFHKEKLSEMHGKYNNLQDQLDQVLSSAIYREIEQELSKHYRLSNEEPRSRRASCVRRESSYATVSSITDLYKNLKGKMGLSAGSESTTITLTVEDECNSEMSQFPSSPKQQDDSTIKVGKRKMSELADKLSENLRMSSSRLSTIGINFSGVQNPASCIFKSRGSVSSKNLIDSYLNRRCSSTTHPTLNYNGNSSTFETSTKHASFSTGNSSPTKKKIIASYKKKICHLKSAFKELYFNLVLFEQYTQLNYNGFEQILRKHDRMFASTSGRKFYQEHIQTADFYMNLHAIDNLIEGVEHVYTLHFENGNRRKAIEKLQVPSNIYKPSSPVLDFRVGYELGIFTLLFILVILTGLIKDVDYDWRTVFKLYRSPLILIIFLFQSGISIIIWKHYKINHVLIFELNPRNNLSSQHFIEFASLLGIIWSLSVLLFLYSEHLNIKPSICPLIVIIMIGLYLFNPTATCHHQARFWLLKILVSRLEIINSKVNFCHRTTNIFRTL